MQKLLKSNYSNWTVKKNYIITSCNKIRKKRTKESARHSTKGFIHFYFIS